MKDRGCRGGLVLASAFAAGEVCAQLPHTLAGITCGLCIVALLGLVGRRLLRRRRDDRGADDADAKP